MVATAKGRETREGILRRAADIFNTRGYFGTSISDVLAATGLEKGGLYNHFTSKDQLALEAFDYAVARVRERYRAALSDKTHAAERLLAIVEGFASANSKPAVKGGCPILNTAIEADDAHPELRERARKAMDDWQTSIVEIAKRGVASGELRREIDPETIASIITATLEGALMLSKLFSDGAHLRRAVEHLTTFIESLRTDGRR